MNTELSIRNLKHRMENLSEWAMYKDGIGKLHIESFIKELSEIEDNATSELTTLRAQTERLTRRLNWIRINPNDGVALRFALEATDKEIDDVKHLITERDE